MENRLSLMLLAADLPAVPGPARACPAPPGPQFCTVGAMLFRLIVWSERDWEALPAPERPRQAIRVPGLGWVGAVPDCWLN